jgi:hypothetical protein
VLKPGKVGATMYFRIVAATLLTASLAYSQAGPSSVGITPSPQLRSYTKTLAAKTRIKTSVDEFVLWIDETKWKQDKSDTPGILKFSHVNGEALAVLITDHIGIPTDVMREAVLQSAKRGDPNARITSEEKRIVNGRQVLAVEMSLTLEGVPVKIFGYYYGGSSGNVQVIGIIPEAVFTTNIGEVTEFLNGLDLSDRQLPTSANREVMSGQGLLSVNSKVTIKYDPEKWRQTRSNEVATFLFTHSSGDGYVKVISERLSTPFDSLPDMVLSNLQSEDPNGTIVFKEKRRVNGAEVWFVKSYAEINKIPVVMCGYYYSGKGGTVQVVAFTGKTLFSEFDKDFMDFLNGLRISE